MYVTITIFVLEQTTIITIFMLKNMVASKFGRFESDGNFTFHSEKSKKFAGRSQEINYRSNLIQKKICRAHPLIIL